MSTLVRILCAIIALWRERKAKPLKGGDAKSPALRVSNPKAAGLLDQDDRYELSATVHGEHWDIGKGTGRKLIC
jgi:hypothetical protein